MEVDWISVWCGGGVGGFCRVAEYDRVAGGFLVGDGHGVGGCCGVLGLGIDVRGPGGRDAREPWRTIAGLILAGVLNTPGGSEWYKRLINRVGYLWY